MKYSSKTLIFCAIFLLALLTLSAVRDKPDIEGEWIGGYKLKDKWIFINAHFKIEEGVMKADIELPFDKEVHLAPTLVSIERSCVKFEILNGSDKILFDGECNGITISGNVKNGLKKGTFHLFRVSKIESDLAPGEMSSSQP